MCVALIRKTGPYFLMTSLQTDFLMMLKLLSCVMNGCFMVISETVSPLVPHLLGAGVVVFTVYLLDLATFNYGSLLLGLISFIP
jgi:hypothetical protein